MGIKDYLAELFADVVEDIIVQTLGDSALERFKSIFSPDKRKRKRALIQAFKSAIENTHEISPELKEALGNREFAENLLKDVLIGDFERIKELAGNYGIFDIDDFVRDFERELRLKDEFREIITEIRKIRDLDRIAENTEALKKHLVGEDAEKLLNDYFETIEERFGYLDLKGFSPRIGRKGIVKIPLDDIFIPLKFVEEVKIDYGETRYGETGYGKSGAKIIGMDDLLKYDRCVILGDPGSGKTTLLKSLAYEKRSYIPIYVRIADYSEKMSQFGDLYSFVVNSDSKYKNLFKWAIENGKALILQDGLDEVIDASYRMKVSVEIRKLLTSFLNNKYIVTSRLIGYESARLAGFEHFTIQPFEEKDIEHFAKRWYKAIAEESDKDFKEAEKSANELIEAISRNKNIERLATNPLLMTIIALIHYRGKKLPNRRVELYQVCVETMLESWVLQRVPSEEYLKDKEALIEILSPVAFYIHATSPRGLIDEDTFMEKMVDVMVREQGIDKRSAKKESKEIRRYLEEESGLFLEKGKEEGKSLYGFFHLSFQEYFAALELVDRWKKGQIDLNNYVFDSRWIEIVRLGAADLGSAAKRGRYEATEFVEAILNVEDDFEEAKRPLILAGYVLSDDVKLEPSIENKIIDDLFYEYHNTDYKELKFLITNVIEELLSSDKERIISERIKELAISGSVRAVELLRLIDVEESIPILSHLVRSKSVEIRRAAAFIIMNISHSVRATKKFIGILNTLIKDKDFITFLYIANAFRELSSQNISFPDKLRKSLNFRKYSLFLSRHGLSSIGLDELVRDNDHKIREIATQIKRHELHPVILLSYPYPIAICLSSDPPSFRSILATKPNSDLAYFETSSMNTDIVEYIRAVKNSDLPEDSKLLAMGRGGPIIIGAGPKLTIKDFGKIVNTFRNELDVLYSITVRLGYPFRQNKLSAHDFPKTDDPVIILLISDILNEKPDEGIIKECIDIFREEKNNKNKRVLFSMLHHFLTPFSGLMSSIMSSKMTYGRFTWK
jgi:energy-coupling factor transporter ATP-binding protein EcfA2